jgi:hypothetical protein
VSMIRGIKTVFGSKIHKPILANKASRGKIRTKCGAETWYRHSRVVSPGQMAEVRAFRPFRLCRKCFPECYRKLPSGAVVSHGAADNQSKPNKVRYRHSAPQAVYEVVCELPEASSHVGTPCVLIYGGLYNKRHYMARWKDLVKV